ncbi:MAG: prevent-host-death family protein [Meiothermus sp.]
MYNALLIKIQTPAEDSVPPTDLRNNLARVMQRAKERKSPVIPTQSGPATAVMMDIDARTEPADNREAARQAIDGLVALAKGEHPTFGGVKPRAKR